MAGGKGKIIGVLFGAMSYTVIDKIIVALGLGGLINDAIKGVILLAAVFLQVVGPMLRGVKLTDQIKEIAGKWLAFGKTKKQLAAEAEGGESVALDASEDDRGGRGCRTCRRGCSRRSRVSRSRGRRDKSRGGCLRRGGQIRRLIPPPCGAASPLNVIRTNLARAFRFPFAKVRPVRGRVLSSGRNFR